MLRNMHYQEWPWCRIILVLSLTAVSQGEEPTYKVGGRTIDGFTVYTLLGALAIVLYFLKANFFILIVNRSGNLLLNLKGGDQANFLGNINFE